jgi:anti-sigma B factor antagonist
MTFNYDKTDKYITLHVSVERLDSTVSPNLKSQLVVLNAEGNKNIILDVSKCKYCDSSGLSAILVANRLCKNTNGQFILAGVQEAVKKLISISQLDTILTITDNINSAVELIQQEEINN